MNKIAGISSTSELRKTNYSSVYRMIYNEQQTSKQAIATSLNMSLPTVSQYLKELEEVGLIQKAGYYESTGGRKPHILQAVASARVAAGLEIRHDMVRLNLVDLYGSLLAEEVYPVSFEKNDKYYDDLCAWVDTILKRSNLAPEHILGVGIGTQNLISPDGKETAFGKLLPVGIRVSDFSSRLPYPCVLVHDVELAALAELWHRPDLKNIIYLSLNRNLGGALVTDGNVHVGTYSSGTIEHMGFMPNGLLCYCGKRGCLEAYCSAKALELQAEEPLDQFFFNLRMGRKYEVKIWDIYLKNLAIAIDNMRMVYRVDILIGGLLQHYMTTDDYEKLSDYVFEQTFFQVRDLNIISSKIGQRATANGGAIYYIQKFLDNI